MQLTKLSRYYGKTFELTESENGKTAARFLPGGRTVFIAGKTEPAPYQKLYVCSPLSAPSPEGIEANMRKARQYMWETAACYGCRAIAPHAYLPRLLNDRIPAERTLALSFGRGLLWPPAMGSSFAETPSPKGWPRRSPTRFLWRCRC